MPGSQMWVLQEVARTTGDRYRRIGAAHGRASVHLQSSCRQAGGRATASTKAEEPALISAGSACIWPTMGEAALAALPGSAEGILPEALAALPEVVLKTLHINLNELIQHLPGKDESCAGTPLADMLGQVESEDD